jgi:hypothetical protein
VRLPSAKTRRRCARLIVALPLSPRALVLLTDSEVYKVAKSKHGVSLVTNRREVVDLNLAQCFKAHENLYFASLAGVRETLDEFEKRKNVLRRKAAPLTETAVRSGNRTGNQGVLPRALFGNSASTFDGLLGYIAASLRLLGSSLEPGEAVGVPGISFITLTDWGSSASFGIPVERRDTPGVDGDILSAIDLQAKKFGFRI